MTTYLALYAKNTAKKNKKWLDGTITANPAGSNRMRVKLSTEEGLELESDFVKNCAEGDELTLERHLVQVLEATGGTGATAPTPVTAVQAPPPPPPPNRRKPMAAVRPALAAAPEQRDHPPAHGWAPPAPWSATPQPCSAPPQPQTQPYCAPPQGWSAPVHAGNVPAQQWLRPAAEAPPARSTSQLLAMLQGSDAPAPAPAAPPAPLPASSKPATRQRC